MPTDRELLAQWRAFGRYWWKIVRWAWMRTLPHLLGLFSGTAIAGGVVSFLLNSRRGGWPLALAEWRASALIALAVGTLGLLLTFAYNVVLAPGVLDAEAEKRIRSLEGVPNPRFALRRSGAAQLYRFGQGQPDDCFVVVVRKLLVVSLLDRAATLKIALRVPLKGQSNKRVQTDGNDYTKRELLQVAKERGYELPENPVSLRSGQAIEGDFVFALSVVNFFLVTDADPTDALAWDQAELIATDTLTDSSEHTPLNAFWDIPPGATRHLPPFDANDLGLSVQ